MPKVIGLTGGIASGKSLVSRTLQGLGMTVIDADEISHELMAEDAAIKQHVVKTFGTGVLSPNGDVDRGKLGKIVFQDAGLRKDLEQILHPRILAELSKRTRESKGNVVLEIPLLIEQEGHEHVDLVVVVYSTRERQIQRLMDRDGISQEEAVRRIEAQLPLEEKVAYAHYVIDNSGTIEETTDQVTRLYKQIRENERS
jgi:dephospho-CoA kinase